MDVFHLSLDLKDFFNHFPQIKKSYYFLPRSFVTVLHWTFTGTTGQLFKWRSYTDEQLVDHHRSVVDSIFEEWESYNYSEDMSNARFVGDKLSLNIYEYTEEMIWHLCKYIEGMIGRGQESVVIAQVDDTYLAYSHITLQLQRTTTSNPST